MKSFLYIVLLIGFYKINAQKTLEGVYLRDVLFSYEKYEFFKDGVFTFQKGGDLGVSSKGKGNYKIKNDSLFLNYNLTSLKENSYFKSKSYFNEKDSITLEFKVCNLEEKPLKNVMIYSLNEQKESVDASEDKDGNRTLVFKKGNYKDKVEVFIDGEFLDRQILVLRSDRNYILEVYMSNSESQGFYHPKAIKGDIQAYKILNFEDNFIELKNTEVNFKLIKNKN